MIAELPGLRQGVRALQVARGLLLHDPLRWRLFSLPAGLAPGKQRAFLQQHGLDEASPPPPARARLRQLFWVGIDQIPEGELRTPPGARFSCACCGASCRTMRLGPILPADVQRLLALDWSGTGHQPSAFFVDEDDRPVEAQGGNAQPFLRRNGSRCQFLRDDGLCEVHARFGAQAKPLMCRLFPYIYRATPTGVTVGMRIGECASAPVTSRGLPVVEQHGDLLGMLAEHDGIGLVPPSVWVAPGRLIAWEEYQRIERELLARPAQEAPGAFAAAVLRAFDPAPAPAPDGLGEVLRRADVPAREPRALDAATLELEDRFCRAALFSKDLFLPPDLATGAALLAIKCRIARIEAEDGTPQALNLAWKAAADRPLRDLCSGLDVRGIAAAMATS